jgi:GxxExxY protein
MFRNNYYLTKKTVTQLSYDITGFAIKVHKSIGPGLLENVYEKCLKYELENNGYEVSQQMSVPIIYDDLQLDANFRLDLLVNETVIVEIKAHESILPIHEAQLITYMKLLQKPQGLIINFFSNNITKSMKPFVNEYFSVLPDE